MAGLTIDELLKGYTIRPAESTNKAKARSWLLDEYAQPFPHKVYAAIMALAMTEAKSGSGKKFSFRDLKAYALRLVAAGGSEDYFVGEHGFSSVEEGDLKEDFSEEIRKVKVQLGKGRLSAADLEDMIKAGSEGGEIEKRGGIELRTVAYGLGDIAKSTRAYLMTRKDKEYIPYLKPLETQGPRTVSYALIM